MLSHYEKVLISISCADACKSILKDWPERRYRAVLDNNIGQLEFYEWENRIKNSIHLETKEDAAEFHVFAWACFKDECIDYFTKYKRFDE